MNLPRADDVIAMVLALALASQEVAMKSADNPVNAVAQRLPLPSSFRLPSIDVPGKILFPNSRYPGSFNVLGLGDIVVPGLVLGELAQR